MFSRVFFAVLKHRYLRWFRALPKTSEKHVTFVQESQRNQVKYRVFRCFMRSAKTSLFTVVWSLKENTEKHVQFVPIYPCLEQKSRVLSCFVDGAKTSVFVMV